jgi:type IV secretion system protein VirB11
MQCLNADHPVMGSHFPCRFTGKTTLANAILAEPAFAADRVVLIEDIAELQCAAADKLEMLTKRTEPAVTMTDLVRDTLRLRPDRIIIGEVRDGSALDLLKAWNTGHPGGLATIHANSAAEALTRLEDLIGEVTRECHTARSPRRSIWWCSLNARPPVGAFGR